MNDSQKPNIHEFTVGELSRTLKRTVEDSFSHVRVRGEISGLKRAASGHIYFALKDADAVLDAVCWKGVAGRLRFQPEDGLEMVATGKLTTYPQRSRYQIVVDSLEHAGEGALMALLEERRKKLTSEGLFEVGRKRALPFLPKVIGVVTSPTGAVIRDILHRLSDRFPRHVLVWPVLVQGEGAAEQIANAIRGFNELDGEGDMPRPDVIIVARGGGSLEDLWAFNEEIVVRAAADSDIPLISAVGHETDTTLIDHASDRRAPTPTAAAEMAVPVRDELLEKLNTLSGRQARARRRQFEVLADRIKGLARGLPRPRDLLTLAVQRLDDVGDRLPNSLVAAANQWGLRLARIAGRLSPLQLVQRQTHLRSKLDAASARMERAIAQLQRRARENLKAQTRLLQGLSHQSVLDRGFAVIYDGAGVPITSRDAVGSGDAIEVALKDGRFGATVDGATPRKSVRQKVKPRKSGKQQERQGKLL